MLRRAETCRYVDDPNLEIGVFETNVCVTPGEWFSWGGVLLQRGGTAETASIQRF